MERIETFQDGELIDSRIVNTASSPNFSGFIAQMVQQPSYNQMTLATTEQSNKNRLEIALVRLELKSDSFNNEDLEFIKSLWNSVIDGVTNGLLTPDDLVVWRQVAESNEMPWTFDDDFKIQLN